MKLISFAVPCYNSAEYMKNCIESLLVGGDEVEIIIVDDGSTDDTGSIADMYLEKFPNIVKVIHQKNSGHGEGVNQGIMNASGVFYKVVDSDDWLDADSLRKVLDVIRDHVQKNIKLDMIICNYAYKNNHYKNSCVIDYRNVFPSGRVINWSDIRFFKASQYLVMHSIIYSLDVVRKSGVHLPKHTFYVDGLFVYVPLPFAENFYYVDTDLYCYFIGRDDQSVNESVLQSRIDQQILVTKLIIDSHDVGKIFKKNEKLAKYMVRFVAIMMSISSVHLTLIGTREAFNKKRDLWEYLLNSSTKLYKKVVFGTWAGFTKPSGKVYSKLLTVGYRIAQKIYKFN